MEKIFKPVKENEVSYIKVNKSPITPQQLEILSLSPEQKYELLDNLVKNMEDMFKKLDILK